MNDFNDTNLMSLKVTCPFQNIEVVEDHVYFSILRRKPRSTSLVTYFTVDNETKYAYRPFFDDFGPPSLLQLTEFYRLLENMLNEVEEERNKKQAAGIKNINVFNTNNNTSKSFHQSLLQSQTRLLHFYTSPVPQLCANGVMYISFFRMLHLNLSPEEAYKPFIPIQGYVFDYRDASTAPSVFELKIIDCLRGVRLAMNLNWYNPDTFDSPRWSFYEQIINGDMNWIIPGKLLAFASPYSMKILPSGDQVSTPETVIPVFKEIGINHIVRLNKKYYDSEVFTNEGFRFTELYFLDGSIPPPQILQKWLDIIETEGEVVALHCKAGLGRTGTLAGCYIMKNFDFTAREAIAWIRICRGGSIIGPQQLFLVSYQEELDMMKREEEERKEEIELQKRKESLLNYSIHEPESQGSDQNYENVLNSNSMMPLPSPPPPPKSARILFVPFKGYPLKNDDDFDDGYNFTPRTSYSRNKKTNSKPRSNFGGRDESSQKSARSLRKSTALRDQRLFGMNALPINVLHPQPRKVAQKKPYWQTVGSYA